jgi:peptide alpha-N-acetyltransferase
VNDGKKEEAPLPDPDPLGQQLLKTESPLEEAYKLWQPLERHAAGRIETWLAGYEIAVRRSKQAPQLDAGRADIVLELYLVALKCLVESAAIDKENSDLHRQTLHYRAASKCSTNLSTGHSLMHPVASASDLPAAIIATIDATLPELITKDIPSEEFSTAFLSRHPTSPAHILGAAQGLLEIKRACTPLPEDTVADVQSILRRLLEDGVPPNVEVLQKATELLRAAGAGQEVVDAWKGKCRARLPLAWVFASADEKVQRRKVVEIVANGTVKADV